LRRAGVIGLWQFETEIRCENYFTTSGYRKHYDAIVTFALNGTARGPRWNTNERANLRRSTNAFALS
jgi:hypothetical protein